MRTCSTYNFKGALCAPGRGWPPFMRKRRTTAALTVERRCVPPVAGWPLGDRGAPGAGCLPLAPSGHVGADAHSPPRPTTWAARRNVSGGARGLQTGPSLRRPHSEALRARGQDRSLALASLRDPFGPLDRSAAGIQGRLSEEWPGPSATPPVAAVCSNRPGPSRLIAGHEHYKSARHAPSWPHGPYLLSSGSRVRILPGAPGQSHIGILIGRAGTQTSRASTVTPANGQRRGHREDSIYSDSSKNRYGCCGQLISNSLPSGSFIPTA